MTASDRQQVASPDRARSPVPKSPGPSTHNPGQLDAASLSILALQRSAGNAAVTDLIEGAPGERPSLQRDDGGEGGTAVAVRPPATGNEWTQQRSEMEGVRQRAQMRQLKAEACAGLAADVLTSARIQLEAASVVYGGAYDNYARVIAAAKKAAKSEEEFIEIGVSILLAVAFATGVGAAAEGIGVAAGLAAEAGKEAIVATGVELVKYGTKHKTGLLEVVGSNLEPGGLSPSVMKLQLWEELVRLHSGVLTTIKQAEMQSLVASGAEFAIGEIKAQMGGGAGADLPVPALHDLIGTLAADDAAVPQLDDRLTAAITAMEAIKKGLSQSTPAKGREEEMEKDIWILWMAELPEDEAKTLDIDAIELHLEALNLKTSGYNSGGILGVDTGLYTTKDDCIKMIEAAKEQAGALRKKYSSVGG